MARYIRGRGVWVWGAVAALLVITVWFSTQAFSASMTVTAEPLQNPGGDITYTSDYSGASAIVTRHEGTTPTIDGSDQITDLTVDVNKVAGAVDVTVDLIDNAAAIVDTKTFALNSGAGTFNELIGLTNGTIKYDEVVKIVATYAASGPVTLTLNLTDGYDSKDLDTLTSLSTFIQVNSSNNDWLLIDTPYWISFQFDQTVPVGATIVSAKVYVEHWEDNGFKAGELSWEIGTGTLSSPTVLGSTTPTVVTGDTSEVTVEWDVTTWIDTRAEANDMKLKVLNNSSNGKKVNVDYVYAVVEYTP